MQDEPIFGIDLGTTHSAIGVVESGFPILLADSQSRRLLPSVVAFDDNGEVQSLGWEAKRQANLSPQRVVRSVKRLIGRRLQETDTQNHDYRLQVGADGLAKLELGSSEEPRIWSPVEISAEILKALVRQASAHIEAPIKRAVITVPAYFNDAQRAATKQAGELAGLKVERIINEPTAAALAYGLDKLDESSRIAVYDFGGGTFDLSILELRNGIFEVISTHGDTSLGGDDVDRLIAEAALRAQSPPVDWSELDTTEKTRLLEASERAKCQLSQEQNPPESVTISLPFFRPNLNLDYSLSAKKLTQILKPLLARTRRHCQQALSDANSKPSAIDRVVLVGGSTRLRDVQQQIRELFAQEPDLSQNPDEAIALGATIQAGVLSGAMRQIVLLDVTPLSLGIETLGGLMNVIIPRNTTIPAKAGEMFTNAADGQSSMQVRILQGEREMARDNWQLGELEVPFTSAPKGQARIGIQFSIDANGILEVLARDTLTHIDKVLKIDKTAVDVDDAKVEQMVSESVDHAFEDMNERVFTEAKLKAEELLPAVDIGLSQVADQLGETEIDKIKQAATKVKRALKQKQATPLKQAVKELDQATENMANLLVEKAMEEALMQRLAQEP